jgi:type II restriction/modification system DNA methylase subunit YeeA
LAALGRVIATPCVSKHRVFVFLDPSELADHQLVIIARDDAVTFGILHSRLHEVWALRMCTWLGVGNDPRYTPTTTFETFPFPAGLTPNLSAAVYADDPRAQRIASAANQLNALRENWLNPPELTDRIHEVVLGYPDRVVAKNATAAAELNQRTLTNLYNANPAWLQHSHVELDQAVASAYGWEWPLAEDEILRRLFELNQTRCGAT